MSIDDIIRHIDEDCMHSYRDEADYAWVELQYIPKIIAALKAGQAMRDKYVEDVQGEYGPYTQEELYDLWPDIRAWDAATGGEG